MRGFIIYLVSTLAIASNGRSIGHVEDEVDDIDLEDSAYDYYDNILEYLRGLKAQLEKKKDFENVVDYDYMGDMPVAVTQKPLTEMNDTWQYLNGSLDDPTLVKVERESDLDSEGIIRNKKMRLDTIMSMILRLRGGNASSEDHPNVNIPPTKALQEIFANNKDLLPSTFSNSYAEKVQSFYPSCETPRHTDDDLWADNSNMNLYFELSYPNPAEGTTLSIVSAKLRLYKLSQVNSTNMSLTESNSTSSQPKTENSFINMSAYGLFPQSGSTSSDDDDRLIRVSVHWYTRALRRNRMKRKLLDSQMFSAVGEEWMEFNIRTAVRTWREVGKNYGLMVTVEDEYGVLLPAEQHIHPMNCSKKHGNMRPLPSIIYDAAQQYIKNHQHYPKDQTNRTGRNVSDEMNTFPYPTYPYPIVDLCTMEIPLSEAATNPDIIASKRAVTTNWRNDSLSESFVVVKNDFFNGTKLNNSDSGRSFFTNVGLGSPTISAHDWSNSNSNGQVKNEMVKAQSAETPRLRHSRKQETSVRNESI